MEKQNTEGVFISMENFSSVPPPELWAKIEEKLNKPKYITKTFKIFSYDINYPALNRSSEFLKEK